MISGKRVRLRPVSQADYAWLYETATSPEAGVRWRYRGATPSPESFMGSLWESVLCQYVVESQETREPQGLVVAYGHSSRGMHAYVAVLASPDAVGSGRALEGAFLLLDHVFSTWNLGKVYLEVPGFNLSQFGSLTGLGFVEEARLRDHEWHDGKMWDHFTFALYRSSWNEMAAKFGPVIGVRTQTSS